MRVDVAPKISEGVAVEVSDCVLVLARVVTADADDDAVAEVVAFKDLEAVDTIEGDASAFVDDGVIVNATDAEPPTSEAVGDKLDR